jgi:glycosyltransferase involved in cell wall biosynthesis
VVKRRVLYVLHNHPALSPGGAETYAMNVYRAFLHSDEFEPLLLARADPETYGGTSEQSSLQTGMRFAAFGDDPGQLLALVPEERYDKFFMRMDDQGELARRFTELLLEERPDVVHFHHALFLGAELISAVRRTLPETAIVFTLHEFLPICNHYGQLVRTMGELCMMESPRRCNECFPQHAPQDFFLRKRLIQSHLSQVDLFIAPSRFLLERYVDWGIPRTRIRYEDYAFTPVRRFESQPRSKRNRFAFFGVLTPFKGIEVLLRAMQLLGPAFDGSLEVHGANYAAQPEEMRHRLDDLFTATDATVTYEGPYDHAVLPRLMAETDWVVVPSTWWENSPLVIQEAFMHGRPVICSDVGGMAEKVAHGVNGLHFRVGSPESLAETLATAASRPDLWERLVAGVPPVHTMDDHVPALESIYRRLIGSRVKPGREQAAAAW